MVGFEPTDPFESSVFKTVALDHAQPHFHKLLVPQTGLEPATSLSLEQMRLPSILRHWGIGAQGEIRTHGFADLQSTALGLSATCA